MATEYLLHDGRTMTPEQMTEEIHRLSRGEAPPIVWVAVWPDEGEPGMVNAQVYRTEEGARRDFQSGVGVGFVTVVRSTVQD